MHTLRAYSTFSRTIPRVRMLAVPLRSIHRPDTKEYSTDPQAPVPPDPDFGKHTMGGGENKI